MIPREAREALGLKAGDKLLVTTHDGKILVMEKPAKYHVAIEGLMRGVYGDNYLKKERANWK